MNQIKLEGYDEKFVRLGRGKGIATFFNRNFTFQEEVKKPMYQIAKMSSNEADIINVYRFSNAPSSFIEDFTALINKERETHVVGEFKFCYKSDKTNKIAKAMDELGFR